jgi:hypothetical protein
VCEFEVAFKMSLVLFCHINRDKGGKSSRLQKPSVYRLIARQKCNEMLAEKAVDVESVMIFHVMRNNNNNIGTINSNNRIAATMYSLGTLFVSGIYV